ncbi:MAG: SpoIID/LytB domain-containing protein [Lachnospiraceae bacterium]
MNKNIRTKYVYYIVSIVACVLLIVGLIAILSGNIKKHTSVKKPKAKPQVTEEVKDIPNPVIRVVLKTNGFQNVVHTQVQLKAEHGIVISVGDTTEEISAGEVVTIAPDDARFQNGVIRATAQDPKGTGEEKITIESLKRGYGVPSYRGIIELRTTAEGIVVVNELPMEQYLYAVIPSEMPAAYELEALKTQAVCARSYAYCQSQELSYPEYEAHVDDSTTYQVYGNSKEQETTRQAVDETKGQKLWYQGQVVKTYYFSTSCGKTTDVTAWGTTVSENNQYLQSVSVSNGTKDYEQELPWYRWSAKIPRTTLSNLVSINTGTTIGTIQKIEVTKRGAGDIALQIVVTGDKGSVTVDTENKIRRALGGKGYTITKQDGTTVDSGDLLPSAFFTVEQQGDTYRIDGGGYGHGIGMSQNGANEMAKEQKTYQDILKLFYMGTEIK